MSYALRNTLVLLLAFLLIAGGAWAYLHFIQESKIQNLESQLTTRQTELANKQQIANQYDNLLKQYETASYYFNNNNKALFTTNNEDKVFGFINQLKPSYSDSIFTFTFAFDDSTTSGEYGVITTRISGEAYYRHFVNFIRKIEMSKPLNKIKGVSFTPLNSLDAYGKVSYNFTLESYYDRARLLENPTYTIASAELRTVYNPFFPLIREVEPNSEGLTNIENSNLLAISADRIFIIDQHGVMQRLRVGDDVYLGELKSINLRQQTATFQLNKGGIIELVTLEVQK